MRPSIIPSRTVSVSASKTTTMNALTERQLQFWEDVEDGLAAVGRTIDVSGSDNGLDYQTADEFERIRKFVKSAKGDIPPPVPVADHHDPSEEHIDGLTALPYWDITAEENVKLFPWAKKLEENCDIITEELEKNLADSQSAMFAGDSAWQNNVMGSGWTAVRLQRLGQWNVENCQAFPKTYALLQELQIPLAVRGVCFARQTPQTGVQPHSDGRNFILTTHAALKIPTGCWMNVAEQKREWEEGKCLTLDTSFVHSTRNDHPSDDRHVLILDFWHPELTSTERSSLEFIYDLRNKFESGQIPFRTPTSIVATKEEENKAQGLGSIISSLFNQK